MAEIKFGQVAVQVPLCAMLANAHLSALEDRMVAFDRVGVDVAATDVFGITVVDRTQKSSPILLIA